MGDINKEKEKGVGGVFVPRRLETERRVRCRATSSNTPHVLQRRGCRRVTATVETTKPWSMAFAGPRKTSSSKRGLVRLRGCSNCRWQQEPKEDEKNSVERRLRRRILESTNKEEDK